MRIITQAYVSVESALVADKPNAIAFFVTPEDGSPLTAQKILDAVADYLLMANPEEYQAKNETGH